MAQKKSKDSAASKAPEIVRNSDDFAFGRQNFTLLFISLGVIFIGYLLMAGGRSDDPAVFNEEIFSFRRITLAPLLVLSGYILAIVAILRKAD